MKSHFVEDYERVWTVYMAMIEMRVEVINLVHVFTCGRVFRITKGIRKCKYKGNNKARNYLHISRGNLRHR